MLCVKGILFNKNFPYFFLTRFDKPEEEILMKKNEILDDELFIDKEAFAIPEIMDEMGIERVDVDDATVSLKAFVSASIPVDRRQEAFNWLRERNLDDIIKNDVIIPFGRGQDNIAGDLMVELERKGLHPESKTHIHSMTLKSFIRERVEKGLETDLDLFGAFVARTAEIKPKRRK